MSNILKAHLSLLIANFIYAASFTVAKEVMPVYVQPFGFIFLRVLGAVSIFWLIALGVREKVENKDYLKFFLLGIFGVALNQLLFFKGLNITTPINASIIMISNPIVVLAFSAFFLKEGITLKKIAGIGLGIIGACILLLFNKNFSFGSETLLGDLYVLINSISFGVYLILVKPLMKKYKTITILKWAFLFGFMIVFPFGFDEVKTVNWNFVPSKIWGCIAFIVIGTTCIAYLLNTYALKELSPSVVSVYIYLQPFLASLIALLFGKDEITVVKVVSAILIIGGVYLVSLPKKQVSINIKRR